MGKGLFSILVCILVFFCPEEAQGCVGPGGENTAMLVSETHEEELVASSDAHSSAIKQKAKRVAPASRCCLLTKYVSSNGIAISFPGADGRQLLQRIGSFDVAKSNHLSHIYPSHNFW